MESGRCDLGRHCGEVGEGEEVGQPDTDYQAREGNLGQQIGVSYIRNVIFRPVLVCVSCLCYHPLDSEMAWTGDFWSNTNILKWQNLLFLKIIFRF